MRYLLDTNTCIAAMRNHPKVVARMSIFSPAECAVSTITTYELFTGVEKCADPSKERPKVELLLTTLPQVPFDFKASVEAARIRAALEAQGQVIGPYDLLLAGQARSLSLVMVSANVGEFSRVPGLTIENWEA
jgi:tRNA(fMet)-specific endonuclease VapC